MKKRILFLTLFVLLVFFSAGYSNDFYSFLKKNEISFRFRYGYNTTFYKYSSLGDVYDKYKYEVFGIGDYLLKKNWYEILLKGSPFSLFTIEYTYLRIPKGKRINYYVDYGVTKNEVKVSTWILKGVKVQSGISQSLSTYLYNNPVPSYEWNTGTWNIENNLRYNKEVLDTSYYIEVELRTK